MDRPIVSTGQYNLNFVDYNNEWERVLDEEDFDDFEELSKKEFKEIVSKLKKMKIGKTSK